VIALTGVLGRGDTTAWLGYFICYIIIHLAASRLLKVATEQRSG
jgi:hypothetical protein